ncbi:hypothetical protein HGRIS_010312 [Hohenbuehelia grisea]|uniref:Fe2OG dioxygenase domain-containing protein n=1 Tax=Hohenbuehelia grisea TaxID=104357 RepID=A0ABR3J3X2_9AGAR
MTGGSAFMSASGIDPVDLASTAANHRFSPEVGQKRERTSPCHSEFAKKPKVSLRIDIPAPTVASNDGADLIFGAEPSTQASQEEESLFTPANGSPSSDSLFDEDVCGTSSTQPSSLDFPSDALLPSLSPVIASRSAPPISGLFFDASILIPEALAQRVHSACMETYFSEPHINQIMLFNRAPAKPSSTQAPSSISPSSFHPILHELLSTISTVLRPHIPAKMHDLLFPTSATRARQAILNLYTPGEGITPHVDLLGRFGDGIIGVSFGSACAMRFDKVPEIPSLDAAPSEGQPCATDAVLDRYELYLPERSILVLSEDARYNWTHGIDRRVEDTIEPPENARVDGRGEPVTVNRGTRMSITFRWLLPGAEVVGDDT